MTTLTIINPSSLQSLRKRGKGKRNMAKRHKKRRSAAQRAATRKMLAANRARRGIHRNPSRKGANVAKRKYKRRSKAVSVTPRKYRRRGGRRSSAVRSYSGGAGIVPMLKNAGIGAGGALAVDVAMGFAAKMLPANMVSPMNADGSPNFMYSVAKGAIALGLAAAGKRVLPGGMAAKMAEGSLIVTLHNTAAMMVPTGGALTLGWASPARIVNQRQNVTQMAEYVQRAGGNRMQEYLRRN